jgi:DNA-binding CsgD family transcriptional regulator
MKTAVTLTKVKEISAIWSGMEKSINNIGFDYCIYHHIKPNGDSIGVINTDNAIAWSNHHVANSYVKHDLIAKHARNKEIFIWNKAKENNLHVKKIMDERRSYGMKSGITIPFINKFNNLTSWISLSIQNCQNYLDSIINEPNFYEKIYDFHINVITKTLSNMTGIEFNICYAIVLSQYTNNVNLISQKTGFLTNDLYELFGNLYLFYNTLDLSRLCLFDNSVQGIKIISGFLKENYLLNHTFSKRQLDCIQLIKKGLSVKVTAKNLGISPKTYESYTREIRQKLNCSNQRELIFKLDSGRERLKNLDIITPSTFDSLLSTDQYYH